MSSLSSQNRPVLVLLPGMPGTGALFEPLEEELEENFELSAVSYPPDQALGYEDLLELVLSAVPENRPYFLLGESFSGPLAVMAAHRRRENLLGLILAASFVTSPMPRWINRLQRLARGPVLDARPRSWINDTLMGKDCPEERRRWVHGNLPRLDRGVVSARVRAVLGVNVREELKGLTAPLLYLAGARDWLVGRKCIDTIWLCRPDVEVKVVEGVHMILQTNPHDSATTIIDFCQRAVGGAK